MPRRKLPKIKPTRRDVIDLVFAIVLGLAAAILGLIGWCGVVMA
jgi:hypothetical protein